MNALKARVRNGRLTRDEEDEMTAEERAEHEEAIAEGLADMRAGRSVDGEEFFARLRAR